MQQHSWDIAEKCLLQMLFYIALKRSDMTSTKNIVTGTFLDLSKAFDSIFYSFDPILLHKTKLENPVQKVKFSKHEKNWIALNRGEPQGIVLCPQLFNIYVNDMKDDTDLNSDIILYADDTFICCSGRTISESKLHLEKSITNLIFFFKRNELIVNESKTVFGALKWKEIEKNVVNGCTVLEKNFAKNLGVLTDCNLSFNEEIKN